MVLRQTTHLGLRMLTFAFKHLFESDFAVEVSPKELFVHFSRIQLGDKFPPPPPPPHAFTHPIRRDESLVALADFAHLQLLVVLVNFAHLQFLIYLFKFVNSMGK